jgi:ABC-type polysaccharide/polyol phosphate export permease
MNRQNKTLLLLEDLGGSLRRYRFWLYLGWNDVLKQYRRSFLGPVWITLSTGIFVVAFSLIGAQLFDQDLATYATYFCTGFIIFGFLTSIINDGCQCFIAAESHLKQSYTPKMIFPLQVVVRNFIVFAHNAVVIFLVLLWAGTIPSVNVIGVIFSLTMIFVTGVFLAALLGSLSARFRDIPMMVSTLLQILFFLTPIMWRPEQLTERAQWLVTLNPLASFLSFLRESLLGSSISVTQLVSVLIVTIIVIAAWVLTFRLVRAKIVYWV